MSKKELKDTETEIKEIIEEPVKVTQVKKVYTSPVEVAKDFINGKIRKDEMESLPFNKADLFAIVNSIRNSK